MKKRSVTINVYEKGDRVSTPCGAATVLEDEVLPSNLSLVYRGELVNTKVNVKLDIDDDIKSMNPAYFDLRA